MSTARTYEEHVSEVLDALYDGALLLAGSERRAEALVLDVVVGGADAFRTASPEDFRAWVLTRMCRQHLAFEDERGEDSAAPDARWPVPTEGTAPVPAPHAAGREQELWRLAVRLEEEDPARFGAIVRSALLALPLRARAAMWLIGSARVGHAVAAEALGVDRHALRGLLFRARGPLHERLLRELRSVEASRDRRMRGRPGK